MAPIAAISIPAKNTYATKTDQSVMMTGKCAGLARQADRCGGNASAGAAWPTSNEMTGAHRASRKGHPFVSHAKARITQSLPPYW